MNNTADDFAKRAVEILVERGKQYSTLDADQKPRERNMARTVEIFNLITDRDLTEEDGWRLLSILKMVRGRIRPSFDPDDAVDEANYVFLEAEARARRMSEETGSPSKEGVEPEAYHCGVSRVYGQDSQFSCDRTVNCRCRCNQCQVAKRVQRFAKVEEDGHCVMCGKVELRGGTTFGAFGEPTPWKGKSVCEECITHWVTLVKNWFQLTGHCHNNLCAIHECCCECAECRIAKLEANYEINQRRRNEQRN